MPDRDYLPGGPSPRYRKTYDQVAEWLLKPEIIADGILPAFKKDLKKYGDAPICMLLDVADQLRPVLREPLFAQWRELGMTIDDLANQLHASPLATECARRACKEQLAELRAGERPADLGVSLVLKYQAQLYDVRFAGRIPQDVHSNGTAYQEMMGRLRLVRPWLLEHFTALARQIVNKQSVERIRLPKKHHRPKVDQDTDLEHIGL